MPAADSVAEGREPTVGLLLRRRDPILEPGAPVKADARTALA